ncbi:MAG: cytochrome c [Magnetovibrio sp.]|nr:cytochrome c [Magnetovibrio sp.]
MSIAVITVIGVGIGALFMGSNSEATSADTSNPELVALGKQVYADNCASCHGAELRGQPNWRDRDDEGYLPAPPHDETGHTWHHDDNLLFKITKEGTASIAPVDYKTNMNGFAEILSDTEIWASLAYIKSTWPEQQRASQERMTRNSQQQ